MSLVEEECPNCRLERHYAQIVPHDPCEVNAPFEGDCHLLCANVASVHVCSLMSDTGGFGRTRPYRSHRVPECPICHSKSGHIQTHHLVWGLSALLPRTCPNRTFLSKGVIQPKRASTMQFSTNQRTPRERGKTDKTSFPVKGRVCSSGVHPLPSPPPPGLPPVYRGRECPICPTKA